MYIQLSPFEPGRKLASNPYSNYFAPNVSAPTNQYQNFSEKIKGLFFDWKVLAAIVLLIIALVVIIKKYWR